MDLDRAETVLAEADKEDAESLVSTNEPDGMAGEQTWPTEEEMARTATLDDNSDKSLPDAFAGTTPKSIQKGKLSKVKRKPKGMSDYMASWIIESDEEDEEGDEDEDGQAREPENDIDMDGTEVVKSENQPSNDPDDEEEEDEEMSMDASATKASRKTVAFEDLGEEEEAEQ